MSITIYPEQGEVLNRPPQPSVFDCGNPLTVAEKICNVDKDSVKSVNGIEPDSNGNVEIETGGGGEGTVTSVNGVLPDGSGNVELTADDVGAATTADIPKKLPNPQSLSLQAGDDTVLYDGSQAQSMTITPTQIGAATAAQGKKADTSVQSVNGVKPDGSGNVEVGAGEGTVKSVNDVQPDGEGNVTIDAQDIGVTDGGNVQGKINDIEQELGGVVKTVNGVEPDEQGNVNVGGAATVTVDVGSTVTGEPGREASVTNSGTQQNVVLNFTIPRGATGAQGPKGENGANGAPGEQGPKGDPGPAGADGEPGAAATITVGSTTTVAAGTQASVTNSGTEYAAVLNFTIPRGEQGPKGAPGEQGPKGDPGPAGTDGEPGPAGADGKAATIQVGTVTASAPGSSPQVTNDGSENAAVFNFVLPRGEAGPQGPAGESGVTALYELDNSNTAIYHGDYMDTVNFTSNLSPGDTITILLTRENGNITANTLSYISGGYFALTCHPNNNSGATIFNNALIGASSITFGSWYCGYEFTGTLGQNLCTYVQVYRQRYSLAQTDALASAEGVRF